MARNKMTQLIDFLQTDLCVDIPLFYNNQPDAVRLDFIEIGTAQARQTVKAALQFIFGGQPFWLCAYGSNSGSLFHDNHLLQRPTKVMVLPYHSKVDRDWFEYDHDAMACVEISLETLAIENYLDYVFRLEFLSNTLFLVNTERKVAAHVYDRRGMDVAATNPALLEHFRQEFKQYLYA